MHAFGKPFVAGLCSLTHTRAHRAFAPDARHDGLLRPAVAAAVVRGLTVQQPTCAEVGGGSSHTCMGECVRRGGEGVAGNRWSQAVGTEADH